jgi:hypothetical protein
LRMGDCKDKSALFYSMLKAIGVKAVPVLVATNRYRTTNIDLPTMTIFDHMIICFNLKNGKMNCSDLTNSYADWRYISPYIQGKVALSLEPHAKLFNLPARKYRWSFKVNTELTFDKKGGQAERQERSYSAEYASYWREMLGGKNSKEVNDYLTKDYEDNVAEKVDLSIETSDTNDLTKAVVIKSQANYLPFINIKTDLDYKENDAWIKAELNGFKLANKIYGVNFSGSYIVSTTTWDASSNWKLTVLPAELKLKHKFGEMNRSINKIGPGKFKVTTQVKLPMRFIEPNEIMEFNQLLEILKDESKISLYAELI